ncbi:hypothetical protein CARUB_v10016756mg [Capsella rubella]|uniref:FHA domain-containing protein n=1 Tax=Capsella rubella TaxID=81985 RepID=R0FM73_9BRAS|nr:hypothetical protein CARUB_v10016756mg [Capsella rubella]
MGALAQVVPWIPEDDLLLKNAIEAGASLESLAKGAVQFSRRFSIRELQDRWHALLYDPVVSADAAFRMTELERFLVPPNDSHFMDNGDGTHLGLEDSHMDIIHNAFPEILAEGGCVTHVVSEDNLQGDIPYVGGENLAFTEHVVPSGCDAVYQDSKQKLENMAHEAKTTMASTDFLAQLSTSLFEEDPESFMEVDGKEVDKSYYDGLSSLLDSTNDTNPEALPNSTEQEPLTAPTNPGGATLDDHVMLELDGTSEMSLVECKSVSDSSALDPHPEIVEGVICCLLNLEDPDIPCNDDIFVSNNSHPMSVSSLARRNFKETNNPITTCVRDISASKERSEGYSLQTQKKTPGRSQGSTQGKPEKGQPSQGSKIRTSTSTELQNTVAPGGSTCVGSAQACSNTLLSAGTGAKDGKKEIAGATLFVGSEGNGNCPEKDSENCKEKKDVLPSNEASHPKDTDEGLIEVPDPELEINPVEADIPVCESDEDLPNYSDIEAMILDMDLDPDDQDNFDLEVSKYQSQDMKRTIIRLEQAAYSYMQRAIASRGAFAVLYGRYSKHYIKKPEVLVGRSTEDLAVDIDLGREKRGSKISRRQAIIRLSDDGSFHMKNLGKYSISVNEKEVDPGQSLILKSDCLVEIRGMPFIFETNQSRMKEYLMRTGKVK